MAAWSIFLLFLILIIGIPIGFSIVGITSIGLLSSGVSLDVIAHQLFSGVDSFVLIAIPLFILAAELMGKGGLTKRLVSFSNAIVGHLPSGLAIVSIVACVFFAAVTGAAVAATAAIGSIMIPIMKSEGYSIKFTAPLIACAGTIGAVIPPSIPLLVYGAASDTPIAQLFIGGILPGLLMAVGLIIISVWVGRKRNYKGRDNRAPLKEVFTFGKDAVLALLIPVIIIGGIMSGIFTPTESAVIAVVYAWIIGTFVYRELKILEIWQALKYSAVLTGQILIIVAAASLFTWYLTTNQIPQQMTAFLTSSIQEPWLALIVMNIVLLITGSFIDTVSNIVVFTPILLPIIQEYGIDPVHFGVVMTTNLSIGMVTPPLGVCLFVACSIGKIPFREILSKELWLFIGSLIIVLLLITYIPSLVLYFVYILS